ncbi:MAG: hypothetical protein AAF743_10365, partial [Planctomycetota bacterium]
MKFEHTTFESAASQPSDLEHADPTQSHPSTMNPMTDPEMTDVDATQPTVIPRTTSRRRLALAAALALPALTAGTVIAERVEAPDADEPFDDAELVGYLAQNMTGPELFDSAADDLRAGRYEEALAKLQQIDRSTLSGSQSASYDGLLGEAAGAARERRVARAQFEAGEQALEAGDATSAAIAFYAAQQNAFADAGIRAKSQEQFALVGAQLEGTVDAGELYQTAKSEFLDENYEPAREKLIVLEAMGFRAPAFQSSPAVILGKIERAAGPVEVAVNIEEPAVEEMAEEVEVAEAVEAEAPVEDVPAVEEPEVEAPPVAAATPENASDAVAAYQLGLRQYRAKDFDAAKASLAEAESLGYTPGPFEDSPSRVLERIATLQASGEAAGMAQDVPDVPDAEAPEDVEFVPAQDAGGQPEPADTAPSAEQPTNDLESAARAEQLKRAQDAAKADALVEEARQAESAGELARATELYNQALGFNPGNRAANEGRNRVIGQRGLDPRQESLITEFEKEVEAERQAIQYQFNNAITAAQTALNENDF